MIGHDRNRMAHRLAALLMALTLVCGAPAASAEAEPPEGPEEIMETKAAELVPGSRVAVLVGMWEAARAGSPVAPEIPEDEVMGPIAANWYGVYLDPDYRLYVYGADDPSVLPVSGKHAFVVLGYALEDGEMTEELKGRCDAAAAAALAFPDSLLVCSGGATGENNPESHTEAGLMKAYLVSRWGIDPDRILIDEEAADTLENAVNTFAILRAQGIETITLVTSDYHQKRAQAVYTAVGAVTRQETGCGVEIIGNYCYAAEPDPALLEQDAAIAIIQVIQILDLPDEERELFYGSVEF